MGWEYGIRFMGTDGVIFVGEGGEFREERNLGEQGGYSGPFQPV